ncbi:MAG TPA: response regulator [Gemmatimonadales bacterium]
MSTSIEAPSVILTALGPDRAFSGVLKSSQHSFVEVPSGLLALRWAHEVKPDAIVLDIDLPDMSGIEACRMLRDDPGVGRNVPILILSAEYPSPEQRVAALRAGAWDFLRPSDDEEELSLRLQTYVQAKRNVDADRGERLIDPSTGLHSRHMLAHRARELGALMVRKNGAMACVVFALDGTERVRRVAGVVTRMARVSDVVGSMGPEALGVLAPATDDVGALKFVRRVANALRSGNATPGLDAAAVLRVGYDAVANLRYTPADPVELLVRAAAAVQSGKPDPEHPWVRRFEASRVSGPTAGGGGGQRVSPTGLTLESAG